MQIPVLIERVDSNGYRARGLEPFGFTAEGATEEEALQKLREQVQSRLASGARVVQLDVPEEHPWARFAGTWKEGDPFIEEWKKAVEEYRRQIDEDPDAL
jgi:hypothetical protein